MMNMREASVDSAGRTLDCVAQAYGISSARLLAPGRDPLLVEARRVAMLLLAERGMGATHIGRLIRRDHSTVLHHLAVIRQRPTPEEREMLSDLRVATRQP